MTLTFAGALDERLLGFWQSFVIKQAAAIFHGKTERTSCVWAEFLLQATQRGGVATSWQIMRPFMAFSLNRGAQQRWCDDDSYDGPSKEAAGSVFVLILM